MRNFSIYEQLGIVIPGAAFLFGILFYAPELRDVLGKDGINIGGLGLFLLVAFSAGHLLAALGNLIESLYWRARGGMPTNWIIGPTPRLLSRPQVLNIETKVNKRLGLSVPALSACDAAMWFSISRQIYTDVERHGRTARVKAFNGNYGLNRGLCAAMLALAIVSVVIDRQRWFIGLGLLILSAIYLYRMQRFGVHYARELYNQFLSLPDNITAPKKSGRAPRMAVQQRA